ncbi:MAG: crossover junction endodeoxyribonuclease RuvC [Deltaproteobacteria bacterium]|nr:crossover junction endodeoxyribonuclease RuvC [Deltaproteobacteria bacterium]
MRILGVDPGSLATGYGLIQMDGPKLLHVCHGVIRPPAKIALAEKLLIIFRELSEIIQQHSPQAFAIEKVFVAKNAASALKLCHARGVAMMAGAQHQIPVFEYSALQVKSAVVGYGKADKKQVQHMTRMLLKLPAAAQLDASDALAVAICHGHSRHLESKVSRILSSSSG